MWPATTLASALSALEADAAAELAPVRRIERSQLRADWHRYAVSMPPRILCSFSRLLPRFAGVSREIVLWLTFVASGDFPHRFLVFVASLDRLSDLVRSEFRLATQPHAPRFGAFPAFSATWSRRRGFDHVLLAGKVKLCGLGCRAMRQRLDSATC